MRQKTKLTIAEKLPKSHFGIVADKVLDQLVSGLCTGVYGLPGYGMEFFAKHMVLKLRKADPNLHIHVVNNELDVNKVVNLKDYLSELVDSSTFKLQRVQEFLRANKVIVVLGEVLSPEDEGFFKFLNSLRWLIKENFCVLTIADYSLYTRQDEYLNVAPDIFHPINRKGNFDLPGTKKIIELNNMEYNWQIPIKLAKEIHELSGGSPALTKYICMALYEEGLDLLNFHEKLADVQPLKKRLKDIAMLIPALDIAQQKHLGLIDKNGVLFSKLVRTFVAKNEASELPTLFPKLTNLESKIMSYMFQVPNKVISKDQLSLLLGQDLESYSEWAIYKAMQRLRVKVAPELKIETIRGRGWRLLSE